MWVVGIDEAGYGPNLGPLVQAAVALRLPDHDPAGWKTHRRSVRRTRHKEDGRLLVDDSKKVYPRGGIEALERAVIHALGLAPGSFGEFLGRVALAACLDDLRAEYWFDGDESLPLGEHEARRAALPEFACACSASLVPPALFNQIIDGSGSKGTVLACGLISLMVATQSIGEQDEPIHYCCDKQGGRNFYAAMLQSAFPDGWVVVERESAEESRYRIDGLQRPVTIVFRPRADGDSISVALASMLCKYLREVCMRQFNRFWSKHVPDLAPTAGYPGDSRRYYDAIRIAMASLNLNEDQVWRKR
jgi:ribonuclease HII